MQDGAIVERGSHSQLIDQQGLYARLNLEGRHELIKFGMVKIGVRRVPTALVVDWLGSPPSPQTGTRTVATPIFTLPSAHCCGWEFNCRWHWQDAGGLLAQVPLLRACV